jgi:hydroxymethylpyrimidine/phosphomethylpyrimidine kinase
MEQNAQKTVTVKRHGTGCVLTHKIVTNYGHYQEHQPVLKRVCRSCTSFWLVLRWT